MTTKTFNQFIEIVPLLDESQRATLDIMLNPELYQELKKRNKEADIQVKSGKTISYDKFKKEFRKECIN